MSIKTLTPLIFAGHGSPMNAIEKNIFNDQLLAIGKRFGKDSQKEFEKPKAVLCVSAHYLTDGIKVSSSKNPETVYDFYGFPKELYEIKYEAAGDEDLAKRVKSILKDFVDVDLDYEKSFDHGCWSVMKNIFPEADIPVVELSLDYEKINESGSGEYFFEIGKRLKILREEGILIIASGNIIHNLGLVDFKNINTLDSGYDWAKDFQKITNDFLKNKDFEKLKNFQDIKNNQLAIPEAEHYLPMLYILGAMNDDENIEIFNDYLIAGCLSMTSFLVK